MSHGDTSADELRAVFNEYILPKIEAGEVVELIVESAPASVHSGQPAGTMSELVEYQVGGEPIAIVHRFVTKDGGVGASGRPDPKAIKFDDEWLYVDE